MYTTLISSDGTEELSTLADRKARTITGSSVSSLSFLKDDSGMYGAFFVFPDLSVRCEGVYKLKFLLFEIVGSTVYFCQAINSSKFTVYSAKKFPGMDESTPLTKLFAEQGLKIRVRKEQKPSRLKNNTNSQLKLQPDNFEQHYINQGYQNYSFYPHQNTMHTRNMEPSYMNPGPRQIHYQDPNSKYKSLRKEPSSTHPGSHNPTSINSSSRAREIQKIYHSSTADLNPHHIHNSAHDSNDPGYHNYGRYSYGGKYISNTAYNPDGDQVANIPTKNSIQRGATGSRVNISAQESMNHPSSHLRPSNSSRHSSYINSYYGKGLPPKYNDAPYNAREMSHSKPGYSSQPYSHLAQTSTSTPTSNPKISFDSRGRTHSGAARQLPSPLPSLSRITPQHLNPLDLKAHQRDINTERSYDNDITLSYGPSSQKRHDNPGNSAIFGGPRYQETPNELGFRYNNNPSGYSRLGPKRQMEKYPANSKRPYEQKYSYNQDASIPNYHEYDSKDETSLRSNVTIRDNDSFYFYNDKKRPINTCNDPRNETAAATSYPEINTPYQVSGLVPFDREKKPIKYMRTEEDSFTSTGKKYDTIIQTLANTKLKNMPEHDIGRNPHQLNKPKTTSTSGRIKINDLLTQNSPDPNK